MFCQLDKVAGGATANLQDAGISGRLHQVDQPVTTEKVIFAREIIDSRSTSNTARTPTASRR